MGIGDRDEHQGHHTHEGCTYKEQPLIETSAGAGEAKKLWHITEEVVYQIGATEVEHRQSHCVGQCIAERDGPAYAYQTPLDASAHLSGIGQWAANSQEAIIGHGSQ